MTALRVVQRMKRDSIHSGRRPSGLCGAALLMAARLHEFNRSPADIIKIVKVHESTLRKRLMEFGETPSSALTLEEFMTVDLEEEQDPPAFKAARKKDRERLQKLENIDMEINELQAEIDRQLDEQRQGKSRKRRDVCNIEETDTERFIRESNLTAIKHCVEHDADDPGDGMSDSAMEENENLITGLGPDIASMGLTGLSDRDPESRDKLAGAFEVNSEEIEGTDIDDEELDGYIMTEKETQFKSNLWNKVNADYLLRQKEKEERRQKEKEEGKPEKKRRRTTAKKNKNQTPASSAGEAIEKMLQEKRISSKINYEVLKSLNVSVGSSNNQQQKSEEPFLKSSTKPEVDTLEPPKKISRVTPSQKLDDTFTTSRKSKTSTQRIKKEETVESETNTVAGMDTNAVTASALSVDASDIVDENDDYIDEDVEADPTEMTVGQMLGRHATSEGDDDYGYGYDEDDY